MGEMSSPDSGKGESGGLRAADGRSRAWASMAVQNEFLQKEF